MAHGAAKSDDERARRKEADIPTTDAHGARSGERARQDDARAWPSSDPQKTPTSPGAEHDVTLTRDAARDDEMDPGTARIDLPAPGYPYSEQALTSWFRATYDRVPSERELGVLMNAMAQRDATPPREGPEPDPDGWWMTTSAPPATRR